jgi:hypothetical protein
MVLQILQGTVTMLNLSLDASKSGRLCNVYQLFPNCERRPLKGTKQFRRASASHIYLLYRLVQNDVTDNGFVEYLRKFLAR